MLLDGVPTWTPLVVPSRPGDGATERSSTVSRAAGAGRRKFCCPMLRALADCPKLRALADCARLRALAVKGGRSRSVAPGVATRRELLPAPVVAAASPMRSRGMLARMAAWADVLASCSPPPEAA